jgi:L-alanine-DL-glutamate epimerase-like enolase superfamily enzyme
MASASTHLEAAPVRLGAPSFSLVPIVKLKVAVYTVPTDYPESDGTLQWESTTIVLVHLEAGGETGLGYTYADVATAHLIRTTLANEVLGLDAMDIPLAWHRMVHSVRNLGQTGMAMMAISAVDNALWDLKSKLLGLPLVRLLGAAREKVPAYGSGGFTSYNKPRLQKQLSGWAAQGFRRFKIKIGREPAADVQRVKDAREAIGPANDLFVDANGAYSRKKALYYCEEFARYGVSWHEEPLRSDDLEGLRLLRDRGPAGMAITAGEYGYSLPYFYQMLRAGAVDVIQADASRCGGITGFLGVAKLAEAFQIPLSSHCCPALHLPAACSLPNILHLEYFHDHVRLEQLLFEGAPQASDGFLLPDLSRPGLGLSLKKRDAAPFLIFSSEPS